MIDSNKKLLQAAAGAAGGELLAIEDVFSTYLYTGNGSTQTITNGIDLAGEGGLVWVKWRDGVGDHNLVDSNRGKKVLFSNSTTSEADFLNFTVNAFNSNGFTVGSHPTENVSINWSGNDYASWTFRKAPRFFDVVTYTGDGVAGREIAHGLGTTVGTIIIKRTDASANWVVFHRSLNYNSGNPFWLLLNLTNAESTSGGILSGWDDDSFTVTSSSFSNASGATYVAYLFAHDPLGPSGDGSDGLIACGSYTGTGAAGNQITLGWEPQWILHKRVDTTSDWLLVDNMRELTTGISADLKPNLSDEEFRAFYNLNPNATGFAPNSNAFNASGGTYIYIAIRRGPMRQPTSGTEVFALADSDTTTAAGFPVDSLWSAYREGDSRNTGVYDRLRAIDGTRFLVTSSTAAENTTNPFPLSFANNVGVTRSWGSQWVHRMFRRAPGFFDVLAYTGDGVAGRTVPHNLGVAPELMIVKSRSNAFGWLVYQKDLGNNSYVILQSSNASVSPTTFFNNTDPSADSFTVGNSPAVNSSPATYIAYLFATLPGVSKVGSYTGNGTSQTIDCGFTSGARFVLIKRTDNTGDWYVWDTARGIVTGNDPFLELNTTDAEVTSDDSIDPDSSGFIVNQTATTNVNVSSASYIFYAIA